jgi:hypothetical protein
MAYTLLLMTMVNVASQRTQQYGMQCFVRFSKQGQINAHKLTLYIVLGT